LIAIKLVEKVPLYVLKTILFIYFFNISTCIEENIMFFEKEKNDIFQVECGERTLARPKLLGMSPCKRDYVMTYYFIERMYLD
jgi:hypothetical protein